jgi:hypothetical protein
MSSDDRPTVDLPRGPVAATRYSVRRAATSDERAQSPLVERVERVAVMRPARAGSEPGADPRWRVEIGDERVILRNHGVTIELALDEARHLAETILRAK